MSMELNLAVVYTALSLLILFMSTKLISKSRLHHRLPPSPFPKLPLLGHLHLLNGPPLHRALHSISTKLGPVISLQFGSRLVVVVSSAAVAEECFTKNDIVLANRPRLTMGKHLGYNHTTMLQSPYGDHWRNLRRLGSIEIFSTGRLNNFLSVRRDEINRLLTRLSSENHTYKKVDLTSNLNELPFNVITRMIAGKMYYNGDDTNDKEGAESKHVRETITTAFTQGGATQAGDFVPILKWINGFEKRAKKISTEMDKVLEGIIGEHRKDGSRNSMVDHLLSLQKDQPDYYTDSIIKGLMLNMILAGTDTSSVTIEWAMSLLLNHPRVLKKARDEIDSVIGHDRLVEEFDLSNLPYLQNIISETFRLFPAAPLLVPHEASSDCTIAGYDVPHGTIILVNAWAIHRDPHTWPDPTSFNPDRFENGEAETHKVMPFGMGRRSCPGSGLAQRVVGLALGSLIQCFQWERVSGEEIDLSEGKGLTMPKAEPLVAMCKPRNIMDKLVL